LRYPPHWKFPVLRFVCLFFLFSSQHPLRVLDLRRTVSLLLENPFVRAFFRLLLQEPVPFLLHLFFSAPHIVPKNFCGEDPPRRRLGSSWRYRPTALSRPPPSPDERTHWYLFHQGPPLPMSLLDQSSHLPPGTHSVSCAMPPESSKKDILDFFNGVSQASFHRIRGGLWERRPLVMFDFCSLFVHLFKALFFVRPS